MIWTIAVVLLILWLLGFSFSFGGSLIHALLVIVLVLVVLRLIK
ncbi:MAG: lmo0937 family membrane protein [Candidatus Paceibacterota bacterium]